LRVMKERMPSPFLAAALFSLTVVAPRPTLAATNGVVAFAAYPHLNLWEIGTINPDGTDPRLRTVGTTPAWSPDGRKMAYVSLDTHHIMLRGGLRLSFRPL